MVGEQIPLPPELYTVSQNAMNQPARRITHGSQILKK